MFIVSCLKISLRYLRYLCAYSSCKNKSILSDKKFLASEKAFVLFYLAAVLVRIMLG